MRYPLILRYENKIDMKWMWWECEKAEQHSRGLASGLWQNQQHLHIVPDKHLSNTLRDLHHGNSKYYSINIIFFISLSWQVFSNVKPKVPLPHFKSISSHLLHQKEKSSLHFSTQKYLKVISSSSINLPVFRINNMNLFKFPSEVRFLNLLRIIPAAFCFSPDCSLLSWKAVPKPKDSSQDLPNAEQDGKCAGCKPSWRCQCLGWVNHPQEHNRKFQQFPAPISSNVNSNRVLWVQLLFQTFLSLQEKELPVSSWVVLYSLHVCSLFPCLVWWKCSKALAIICDL